MEQINILEKMRKWTKKLPLYLVTFPQIHRRHGILDKKSVPLCKRALSNTRSREFNFPINIQTSTNPLARDKHEFSAYVHTYVHTLLLLLRHSTRARARELAEYLPKRSCNEYL